MSGQPFYERRIVEALESIARSLEALANPPILVRLERRERSSVVSDEMVERARSVLDDALDHTLPDADGEDFRIVRAALEAALNPEGL